MVVNQWIIIRVSHNTMDVIHGYQLSYWSYSWLSKIPWMLIMVNHGSYFFTVVNGGTYVNVYTPIYSRIPEQKNVPEMRLRRGFSTIIRPSNEALNKKIQLSIFEKIRFEVFSLLKDGQKLEQNH